MSRAACLKVAGVFIMSAGLFTSQVAAQETVETPTEQAPGALSMELNRMSDGEEGGCGLVVVTTNRLSQGLKRAAWQVAVFDQDGVVKSLPVLDFGALPVGKSKVGVFQMPDGACDTISRIIINDVAECTADDGSDLRDSCLQSLETQNRSDIDFGL